jgi:ribosomal protein S18 acetylase RimI-like enzyme
VCEPSCVSKAAIVELPKDGLGELEPLWRAFYEHHIAVTPQLRDRARPFHEAWDSRLQTETGWLESEPDSFVLAARHEDRYLGYAFVRVRSGAGFAASWRFSDPLAELATLAVLPAFRGRGIGSELMDAVEARLRELGVADLAIGVVATNADAIGFYERRAAVAFQTHFIQRVEPNRAAPRAMQA